MRHQRKEFYRNDHCGCCEVSSCVNIESYCVHVVQKHAYEIDITWALDYVLIYLHRLINIVSKAVDNACIWYRYDKL